MPDKCKKVALQQAAANTATVKKSAIAFSSILFTGSLFHYLIANYTSSAMHIDARRITNICAFLFCCFLAEPLAVAGLNLPVH